MICKRCFECTSCEEERYDKEAGSSGTSFLELTSYTASRIPICNIQIHTT